MDEVQQLFNDRLRERGETRLFLACIHPHSCYGGGLLL